MNPLSRKLLFCPSAVAIVYAVATGLRWVPALGEGGGRAAEFINPMIGPKRHVTNAVTAVTFDIRGTDTLGEEFILFAAVMGVSLILRALRSEWEERRGRLEHSRPTSAAIRHSTLAFIGLGFVLGTSTSLHSTISPGGGFQGGVILASSWLAVYLSWGFQDFRELFSMRKTEPAEGIGVGIYILSGILAFWAGDSFLANVLPLGESGVIFCGGAMNLSNLGSAIAVAAGFVILVYEFIRQIEAPGEEDSSV